MLKNLSKSSVGDVNDKVMIVDGLNLFIRWTVPTLNDDGEHDVKLLLSLVLLSEQTNESFDLMVKGSHRRKK